MSDKPHIVRLVAEEARRQFYHPRHDRAPRMLPRILNDEIGVVLNDGQFIPYADLGYHGDIGFFRLSETTDVANEAAPYASTGRLIDCGQIVVTTSVGRRLSQDEIRTVLECHTTGDFGDFGEFYELDITDEMLGEGPAHLWTLGQRNKANTLTGLAPIVSAYTVRDHLVWVITEAGEKRTTVLLYAGVAPE